MGKGLSVCICFVWVITYMMRFFHVPDPELLFALPLAICLSVCLWKFPIRVSLIDIALLLLWGYGLCSPSVNRAGSLMSATDMAVSLSAYFLARCLFVQRQAGGKSLCQTLTICVAMLALSALYQFSVFDHNIHDVGFASLYDFRFLYRPLGVPSNEWNSLQWLWGGLITLTYMQTTDKRIRLLCLFAGLMVWATILLSFSRGGYIAVLICGILTLVILSIKDKSVSGQSSLSRWIVGGCFVLLTSFLCWQYRAEVAQTFCMNETLSQQRSTAGRLEALGFAKDVTDSYPWGVGKGNYTIANDYYRQGETRSDSFTSYAGNIVAKTLVEGGYTGLILYVMVILSVFVWLIRVKRRNYWMIFPFLLGFLIKEVTFPTFYDSEITQLSVFLLLAYVQQDCGKAEDSKRRRLIALIPLLVWTGLYYCRQRHDSTGSTPALIREYLDSHSKATLDRALLQSPMDIQLHYYKAVEMGDTVWLAALSSDYPDRLLFRWTLYEWYRKEGLTDKATNELTRCILRHPSLLETGYWEELRQKEFKMTNDIQMKLRDSIQSATKDVIQLAKYGSIALQLGDMQLAEKYLTQANKQLPNLSRVWGNLAAIEAKKSNDVKGMLYRKRMNLLEQGIFIEEDPTLRKKPDIETMLRHDYRFLFTVWYKTRLE